MRRFNGKCRRCKKGYSVLAGPVTQQGKLPAVIVVANTYQDYVYARETSDGTLAFGFNQATIHRICDCGASVVLSPVAGKLAPEHKCDARCTNATGHDCECACGGRNHGASHGF